MKIKRISWTNYKGLADGTIEADGRDVTVYGRNGAGKSSIASVIPFVLWGKVVGSLRRYDDGHDWPDGLRHYAEIEFDDGTRLMREIKDTKSTASMKTYLFLNGQDVKKAAFDAQVQRLLNGGGELVLNPFAFCNLTVGERRNLLLKFFAVASERDLLALPENAELAQLIGRSTANAFAKQCRDEIKALKREMQNIPALIEEQERNLLDVPEPAAIGELQMQIEAAEAKLKNLQTEPLRRQTERTKVERKINALESAIREYSYSIKSLAGERQRWIDEYRHQSALQSGKCPTCGQVLPQEQFAAKQKAKLNENLQKGLAVGAKANGYAMKLADTVHEVRRLREQYADVLQYEVPEQWSEQCNDLSQEISELKDKHARLKALETAAKRARERIAELKAEGKRYGARIFKLEGHAARAEDFQETTISTIEKQINRHFGLVKVKMFDYKRLTGELKLTCEPTLNGVPFSALSKGEKFMAAIDIVLTFQKVFNVELPIIIDDAESYTAQTLTVLPKNQLILFKVTDGDLQIVIEERRVAA